MISDFFSNTCQEPEISHDRFGICDDEDGTRAYTDTSDSEKWIATVLNKSKLPLKFKAIDNCMLIGKEFEGIKRCDGMLTSNNKLYLFELKNKSKSRYTDALDQLESTIKLLHQYNVNELNNYPYRRALVCNRKHGKRQPFIDSYNEKNKRFHKEYRFRIEFKNTIAIEG